uniref:26S proteasome regulatory subunit Rpn7 N-terminal domain-containing protein n=1 Tax=Chrysotila carterae TaxID=13221 RepID=A0A7S4BKE0_CHRCT
MYLQLQMGHNDLAEFHCDRGDFTTALKCFVRTRDYCTTTKHTVSMCLNVIKISIHMGNFTHVSNYVTKAESTPSGSDALLTSQLKIAAGLTHLSGKKYKLAARKFLEVNADLGSGFNEVASSQDVALYGSLCALAAFDRQELKAKLIDNSAFRTLLELFPECRATDIQNPRNPDQPGAQPACAPAWFSRSKPASLILRALVPEASIVIGFSWRTRPRLPHDSARRTCCLTSTCIGT